MCDVNFTRPLPHRHADLLCRADRHGGGVGGGSRSKEVLHGKWRRKHPQVDVESFGSGSGGSGGKKKRKKNKKTSENGDSIAAVTNFRMIDRYRSIYYATSLGNHEMLVVERPWLHVLRSLPDPIYRKKYGKT